MPEPGASPQPQPGGATQRLCASWELEEKGRAVVFDVLHYRQPVRAFALRFDGRVVAYLNRCAHVPAELDWQPGEFLDGDRELILCTMHGAVYEPLTGRCAGGPCGRGRLTALDVAERDGDVFWAPSGDLQAVPAAATPSPESPPDAGRLLSP